MGKSKLVDDQGTRPQFLMPEPLAVKRRPDIGIGYGGRARHRRLKSIVRPTLLPDLGPPTKRKIDGFLCIANPLLTQEAMAGLLWSSHDWKGAN
jgi:hypothetical protein